MENQSGAPPRHPLVHPDETLDRLSRTLRIIQKKQGQRAASDDVFLAWRAAQAVPDACRALDLGSGKGTVAMLLLQRLPRCRAVGVEALEMSYDLACRNAVLNALENRYAPRLGDLRDPSVLAGEPPFDLITGAPPFKPLGSGTLPRNAQRAAGRFELRGGVNEYVHTAARHLSPSGKLVILMDGLEESRERTERALETEGFFLHSILAVKPRPARASVYWIVEAGRSEADTVEKRLNMRGESGDAWSPDYEAIRREMDLPS
ncbi:MAG: methyltransferase [Syntrophobacteraceae bacterium]|nr:methyltransferase [Desulfobacteraceae bacterium]